MRTKAQKLLRILNDSSPRTATYLADSLNVSVRSIKNYVSEINQEFSGTISSSNTGYAVDKVKIKLILNNLESNIPQTSNERIVYVINKLLKYNMNKEINIYDLSDELYISLSTLKNDLNKVKRKLHNFDLELISKGDFIHVNGLEKNKRKLLSSILYEESNTNFVNIDSLQKAFHNIDIRFIRNTILQTFEKYHYFINDYSLINLVLHVTIAVDRVKNNNFNILDANQSQAVKFHEHELAQEVAKLIGDEFGLVFNHQEIYEMTLLIISRATNIDYSIINESNLEDFIGKDCFLLVHKLIRDINAFYYIDLSEPEFLIRFALHIKNLLIRSKNNYFSKNPLSSSIKTSCPLIYDISVNLAQTIKDATGIAINDDEIAYIAFHIGSALEAQKKLNSKITAAVYCPNYYDLNLRITDSLNQYFANDLLVTNIITDESEIEKVNTDLIISTIPLIQIINRPIFMMNIFISEKDRIQLADKILIIRKEKERKTFKNYLMQLVTPELFECKDNLKTETDCINYMAKKIMKLKYVNDTFISEIMQRESMSSTAFGNFAIPHSMKMYANRTGINILISKSPISWNGQAVNLVLMMFFNKNERYIFNEIYEPITMILTDPENIKKLLEIQNYLEFIDTLVQLL